MIGNIFGTVVIIITLLLTLFYFIFGAITWVDWAIIFLLSVIAVEVIWRNQ